MFEFDLEFDLTGVDPAQRFTLIPPGVYLARSAGPWTVMRSKNNNLLICVDFEVAGESIRYFHTYEPQHKERSKRYLMAFYNAMGILQEGDHEGGQLITDLITAGGKKLTKLPEAAGIKVVGVAVNGQVRPVDALEVQLTISNYAEEVSDGQGGVRERKGHRIERVDRPPQGAGATPVARASTTAPTAAKPQSQGRGKLPF